MDVLTTFHIYWRIKEHFKFNTIISKKCFIYHQKPLSGKCNFKHAVRWIIISFLLFWIHISVVTTHTVTWYYNLLISGSERSITVSLKRFACQMWVSIVSSILRNSWQTVTSRRLDHWFLHRLQHYRALWKAGITCNNIFYTNIFLGMVFESLTCLPLNTHWL